MWLWALGILFLFIIWAGGYVVTLFGVDVALEGQVAASLFVLLLIAGITVYRRLSALAAAKALERQILKQSEEQAKRARPDRRAEILELKKQIEAGIAALKHSKVGRASGARALYALPWYVIVGPPGAGKTTALRHSGIGFPFADPKKGRMRGVGGTRNCDWWFTNEAIILDTAGRYSVEDDDRDEWFAFLDMLQRFRKNKPLNGLIVAVAVNELVQMSDEQLEATGERLRARLDEVMTRLKMVLPVYVMFTKADLLGGFVEFWGDLRKSERDQIYGATLELESRGAPGDEFRREFRELAATTQTRLFRRLASERQPGIRQRVYQFPLEFQSVEDRLANFLDALFQTNAFQENPIFRGFYFTSGTQEGRILDRVVGGVARAFNLPAMLTPAPVVDPKSYFVGDLFKRVVFADRDVASRTEREIRRQRWLRWGLSGVALAIAVMVLVPTSSAFNDNRRLVNSVEAEGSQLRGVNWRNRDTLLVELKAADTVRRRLFELRSWDEAGPPNELRWGMYTGEKLYPAVKASYVKAIEQAFAAPTRQHLEKKLELAAAGGEIATRDFPTHYETLKLYLMMSLVDRLDREWAAPRLVSAWAEATGLPRAEAAASFAPHVDAYLVLLKAQEIEAWQGDTTTISATRTALLRAPRLSRVYEALVQDANHHIAPITKESIFYGLIAPFVSARRGLHVQGAYTREGWSRVRQLLGSERSRLEADRWVLGETEQQGSEEADKQIEELRSLYFARYKKEWADFISDFEVLAPKNAEESLKQLNALSEPEWPYKRMLRILAENVQLDMGALTRVQSLKEQVEKKIKDEVKERLTGEEAAPVQRVYSPVERAFAPMVAFLGSLDPAAVGAPSGLNQYQALVSNLVGVLSDLRDTDGADTETAVKEFELAFRSANGLLTTQDGFTRPLLSPLLMRPITLAWEGVVGAAGNAASDAWESEVWQVWNTTLAGKYPFTKRGGDARINDFVAFFNPVSGLLWQYFEQNLAASIKRSGNVFTPLRRFDRAIAYDPGFISNCLQRGAKITEAVFGSSSEEPKVNFQVNLHSVSKDVSEVSLEIDGVSQSYRNHPEQWLQARWPGAEAAKRGAKVFIRGYPDLREEISRVGDFGFFRLLDVAQVVDDGDQTLVANWQMRSRDAFVKLEVRAARTTRALRSGLFDGYACPKAIASSN